MATDTQQEQQLEVRSVNAIRTLSIDAVEQADSGHPGLPLGAAPAAYALWSRYLRHNPTDPHWFNRDRFVLSAGHGSMLLYSLLYLTGYDLSLDELKRFRQWGSKTPGHPEYGVTPGVETTTGPLGQGFANAVGMAMAERYLAAEFNRPDHAIVDHRTYVLVSDGDLQEGIGAEVASLAGTLKLGKLIAIYDDNDVQLDGPTAMAFREDVPRRFEAYGWGVVQVDGNDVEALAEAIRAAQQDTDRPTLIDSHSVIGYGSPHRAGTSKAHGEPLGADELKLTHRALGWPEDKTFYVPDDVLAHFREAVPRGKQFQAEWEKQFAAYARAFPDAAARFTRQIAGELPQGWDADLPRFSPSDGPLATRQASHQTLIALAAKVPALLGGSADLAGSTGTLLKDSGNFEAGAYGNRNIRYGVREHGMGGIAVGMALHAGIIPYTATFMAFSDYMRAPIRLAALSHTRVIFIFTHDSIGLGEDGPTHQAVEQLLALRAIPGLVVLRPGDANETREAWKVALQLGGPSVLVFTRQGVPIFDRDQMGAAEGTAQGAYILQEAEGGRPDAVLIGTGSEVQIAVEARTLLGQGGIRARTVSMPSWELFDRQPQDYRERVLPRDVPRFSVEAGRTLGWSRYVGTPEHALGVDRFGASAPYKTIFQHYGLTPEHLAEMVKQALGR